jgi:predicted MFS family arabinose efflux permease
MAGAMVLCGLSGMAIPLAVAVPAVALPMVLAAEFGQWFFLVVYRVVEVSVRQTITPDHLQGRVNATERFVVYGVIPLGALLGGFLGEAAGVRVALIAGMLGMLAASLWLLFSPVRSMR